MPDTQFAWCLQYDSTRRLSDRLGDIDSEEKESYNEEDIITSNKKFILKHKVFIHSIENINKKNEAEVIFPAAAVDLKPLTDEEKLQTVTKDLQKWLSDTVDKGITMKTSEESSDKNMYEDYSIGDDYTCITKDMIVETNLSFSRDGLPCGKGSVTLMDGSLLLGVFRGGKRNGRGAVEGGRLEKLGVKRIGGYYTSGILDGRGKVEFLDGMVIEGLFKNGYLEGCVVGKTWSGGDGVFIGEYHRGVAVGPCWRRLEGGGWLHGVVDKEGQFTGEDMMYIYPDLVTCLVGKFKNGVMLEARESMVDMIVNPGEEGSILHVRAATPDPDGHIFSYQPSDDQKMSVDYQQQDPYERDRVECRRSAVKNAGEGVFAITDIPQDTFVCFYHGIYLEEGQNSPQENCEYQIFLDWDAAPASPSLDILPNAWSYKDYKASLGHKVNHSWQPNCQYAKLYHPVFGHTAMGIRTIRQVHRGEELSTNYRYDVDACPEWYYKLYNES